MKIRLFTIPNIITLMSLSCGLTAVFYALRLDDLQYAFYFTIAAAVFDFLDGFAARLLKSYSDTGKQLDSLSDMVSFGVAPGAIMYSMFEYSNCSGINSAWGFGVFIIVLFSGLRLAKFNVDDSQKNKFCGLPTPAAAVFVASAGWIFSKGYFSPHPVYILTCALCLSYFLISPLRMFSLKFTDYRFRSNKIRYIFLLVSLAGIALFGILSVPFIIVLYIVLSLARHLYAQKVDN